MQMWYEYTEFTMIFRGFPASLVGRSACAPFPPDSPVHQGEGVNCLGSKYDIHPIPNSSNISWTTTHSLTHSLTCRNTRRVVGESTVYHLPFVMKWIKRWTWTRFLPVCPTFTGFRLAYRKIRTESSLTERLQGR